MVLGKLNPIMPLPVMLEEEDKKIYEQLEVPKTVVVRYGYMKKIAELPFFGEATPGCGSKLVMSSERGTELAEMLTTTCPNSGCGQAVSRSQMLEYIQNSGGKNYPFSTEGKILRIATREDMKTQADLDTRKREILQKTREAVGELEMEMTPVEIEIMLGFERIIIHYTSENWVDFRELVKVLAKDFQTRVEMHQVSSRDEARLVADYEKCGQHCCCKQFLKILKPISMRSAKTQKATLDPHKISGRCGRLMCCLRYEDQTYNELRKRLPNRRSHVMTDDGTGIIINTQILTQLCLVKLDRTGKMQAYPLEEIRLLDKEEIKQVEAEMAEMHAARERRSGGSDAQAKKDGRQRSSRSEKRMEREPEKATDKASSVGVEDAELDSAESGEEKGKKRRRSRNRRRRKNKAETEALTQENDSSTVDAERDETKVMLAKDVEPKLEKQKKQPKSSEARRSHKKDGTEPVRETQADTDRDENVDLEAFPTGPVPKGRKKSRLANRRRRRGGEKKPAAEAGPQKEGASSSSQKPVDQSSDENNAGKSPDIKVAEDAGPEKGNEEDQAKSSSPRSRGRRKRRPSKRPGGRGRDDR